MFKKGGATISFLLISRPLSKESTRLSFTRAVFFFAVIEFSHQSLTMEALSEPSGGDQNKGPVFSAVVVTFCALACVSVLLRLFVRVGMIHSVGWDDFWIWLTLVDSNPLRNHNFTMTPRDLDSKAFLGTVHLERRLQCHECDCWIRTP